MSVSSCTKNTGLPWRTAQYETHTSLLISGLVEELRSRPTSDNPCQHPLSIPHHLAHTSWMPSREFLTHWHENGGLSAVLMSTHARKGQLQDQITDMKCSSEWEVGGCSLIKVSDILVILYRSASLSDMIICCVLNLVELCCLLNHQRESWQNEQPGFNSYCVNCELVNSKGLQ